jgi:predicted pyridoxine 5'-phosphate oxidase superfamily flavin-nucleotide-binding protein
MHEAFPVANALHAAAQVVASTTVDKIRQAGFDVFPNPTRKLPQHYRLIHPDGVAGFTDATLLRLSAVLSETPGHAL